MAKMCIRDQLIILENFLKTIGCDLPKNFNNRTPTSLQDYMLVTIAVKLWTPDDICEGNVEKYFYHTYIKNKIKSSVLEVRKTFLDKVLGKVNQLELTKVCIKGLNQTIPTIGNEIAKYFSSHHEIDRKSTKDFRSYWNALRWTQDGKVDVIKTTVQLIDNTNLNIIKKYKLACRNCLVEKIRDLQKKLPEGYINEIVLNDANKYDSFKVDLADVDFVGHDFDDEAHYKMPFRLMLFWHFYISNQQNDFSKLINGVNINEYILRYSIYHRNEVTVKYIWDNIADEILKAQLVEITHFATKVNDNSSIVLYLFNQMNLDRLEEACIKMGFGFINSLLCTVGLTKTYVIAANHVLKYINRVDIFDALRTLVVCWQNMALKKDKYIELWTEVGSLSKVEIKENYEKIYKDLYFSYVLKNNDCQTMKLLLQLGTREIKEKLLFGYSAKSICDDLIFSRKLDLLDVLINDSLINLYDINLYKNKFFEANKLKICFSLICSENYQQLDDFLEMFCEYISDFKLNFPYKYKGNCVRRMLKYDAIDKYKKLEAIDNLFRWCCEDDEEFMGMYMADFFDYEYSNHSRVKDRFFKIVKGLINQKEWELMRKYWMVMFYSSLDDISLTENKLMRINKILLIIHELTSGKKYTDLFVRFVTSCFDQEELKILKKELRGRKNFKLVTEGLQGTYMNSDIKNWLTYC